LAKNYDENAKKPDRDPRGAFRNPADLTGAAAGIVGPLGSSSFNLPTVERALSEMEVGLGSSTLASSVSGDAARRRATGRPLPSMLSSSTNVPPIGRPPTSPTAIAGASPSPTSGQTQHEVLQNFFQSLLTSKDRAGATAAAAAAKRTAVPKTNGSTSGAEDAGG
jgi:dynein light intermediate chain 1